MADVKREKELVSCINCAHAVYMQWMKNPVVAHCLVGDERQVAQSLRYCKMYKARNTPPEITHYDSYED